jgi:hypothetical protein
MESGGRALLAAAIAGVVGLGLVTSSAGAATFSLNVAAPATAPIGTVFPVTGSGVDPTDQGTLYLEIDEIPASFTTTCPASYLTASQLASSTGGTLVAFDEREQFDASGNFSNPNAFTGTTAGAVLFCAYTDDAATNTLATASAITKITPATPQAVRPANTGRPRVTRTHNTLSCSRGSWSNKPTSYTYGWLVNGKANPGARKAKLTVKRTLRGRSVRCTVKASNSAGAATARSAPFKVH